MLHSSTGAWNMEIYEMYKRVKKEAKKVVNDVKFKAYDNLYSGLGARE